jgi:hypothetical protein
MCQGLTGAMKENYQKCLLCGLQQQITTTKHVRSVSSWCSIHGVSFLGCTNQREGSKLLQESRILQIARNQEEPVDDDDEVISAKIWADVKAELNVAVSFN